MNNFCTVSSPACYFFHHSLGEVLKKNEVAGGPWERGESSDGGGEGDAEAQGSADRVLLVDGGCGGGGFY